MPVPSRGRVLIVDDEAELMASLHEALGAQGYETAGFTSGRAALNALRERDFDLLLTDLMMPEMNGLHLLRAALEVEPDLVAIVMTGQGTIETAVDSMKTGAFDYVLKPFKLKALLPVLARAMEVRRLRSENWQLRETVEIYELSKAIAFTLDANTILNRVVDAALQQCGADEASLMLRDKTRDELYIAVIRGEDRWHLLGERVPLDRGIAGWVARHREPITLHGEVHDSRFAPLKPRPEIRSSISMPMMAGGELVGVLNVNATKPRRPFSLGQIKALTILVGTAAASLESASLYSRLLEAEAKYRCIFENAIEGIFQTTPEGRCTAANPAMARMLGYESPEELVASGDALKHQLYVEPDRWLELERLLRERGSITGLESRVRRKDGGVIWISQNLRAVSDAGGALLYYEGSIEDVTERRQMQEQLVRAQRLEAAGRIAAQVAHDFNNLLTPFTAYPQLIKMQLPEGHPALPLCDSMVDAASQMAAINEDLMTLGRRGHYEVQPVDVNLVVAQALERISGRPDSMRVDLDLARDVLPVSGSPSQLLRVLSNLLSNAREAMQDAGTITVKTENVYVDVPFGRYNRVEVGEYVKLTVTDTGPAIPSHIRGRVFDAFFTTKLTGDKHGTGLGLSIVQTIVEDHRGYVDLESEAENGVTFSVYLPVCREETTSAANRDDVRGGTETVLVVDDDRLQREVVKRLLETLGYRVEVAASGHEAASFVMNHPVDLMVLDMVMPPGMDGAETYQRVREVRPGQRAIIVSGHALSERVSAAQAMGAGAFLAKPVTLERLARAVRDELERHN